MKIGMVGLGRMGANSPAKAPTRSIISSGNSRNPAPSGSCFPPAPNRTDRHDSGRTRGARRHSHRWWQFLLQGRRAPRRNSPPKGIHYIDAGTSGGVWGAKRGYCLILGGEKQAVTDLEPIFKTLAPGLGNIPRTPGMAEVGGTAEEGYLYCGPSGAGHFVKMLHNGIEYGLMQSYAEGFDILRNANSKELPEDCRYDLSMCSPLLCTRDSAHGKITPTPKRCFPPCDTSSAAVERPARG